MSSLSNDSWGGVSDVESLHSAHFRQKPLLSSLQKQSRRFAPLKIELVDQQPLVDGILAQIYSQLDMFTANGGSPLGEGSMEVDSGLLIRKQSSLAGPQFLGSLSKSLTVEFSESLAQ